MQAKLINRDVISTKLYNKKTLLFRVRQRFSNLKEARRLSKIGKSISKMDRLEKDLLAELVEVRTIRQQLRSKKC